MSLSKKIRFEVFKRDNFTCGYCGKQPPDIVLEVDHITPLSKGGDDDINNLITSCFDCNRGKSNIKLSSITPQIKENLEVLKLKEEQLKEYKKFILTHRKRIKNDVGKVEKEFQVFFNNAGFSESFKVSVGMFLKYFSVDRLIENIQIACSRVDDPHGAIKYFCGICWTNIKEKNIGKATIR